MAVILKDGRAAHVYSGTDAAPASHMGTTGIHPSESPPTSAQLLARLGLDGGERSRIRSVRKRLTIAQVNAGATLVTAIAGVQFRMVDCQAIAVGGAAGAVTTVDILATQAAASVKLAAFAQASLTQSTVLRPGIAGTTVLADGASFAANDANTAITVNKTGAAVTTATHIDVQITYEEIVA